MISNLVLFPLRLVAIVGLLAACLVADLYRRLMTDGHVDSSGASSSSMNRAPLQRRLAYFGVLTMSLVACTLIAVAQLHRV
jgi:hypothetical protein